MIALQSSVEDLLMDDAAASRPMLRRARPVTLFQLPFHQQERLREIDHWRQQYDTLFPGISGRRRSSFEKSIIREMSTTPVIKVQSSVVVSCCEK